MKRCQVVTFKGPRTNLSNGKHQAFCAMQCCWDVETMDKKDRDEKLQGHQDG